MKLVPALGTRSLLTQRLEALLGTMPTLTFHAPAHDGGECCSIRVMRGQGDTWLGAVRDCSAFAERAQRDGHFQFVVHHDGETPLACGEVEARLRGRLGSHVGSDPMSTTVACLLAAQPFASLDWQAVEFKIVGVRLDDGEAPLHGAVPRT